MNKLTLGGIIFAALMLTLTYLAVGGSEGGLHGDIVNMLAAAGAVALVIITVFVVIKYVRQMQTDTATGELAEENWDDIGEYKNPVPMGWAIMFMALIIWGMAYFTVLYPVNAYSQIGEYNEDAKAHAEKFESKYADIKGNELIKMGESVFIAECKVCHGADGKGLDGKAANLHERLATESVKHVVENGSNYGLLYEGSMMPNRESIFNAEGMPISDAEIDAVSKYVANGMTGEGADVFAGACAMCHNADGKGLDGVGPNIANFDSTLVENVLANGKKGAIGAMPSFARLNQKQREAAAAYISAGLPDTDDLKGE